MKFIREFIEENVDRSIDNLIEAVNKTEDFKGVSMDEVKTFFKQNEHKKLLIDQLYHELAVVEKMDVYMMKKPNSIMFSSTGPLAKMITDLTRLWMDGRTNEKLNQINKNKIII